MKRDHQDTPYTMEEIRGTRKKGSSSGVTSKSCIDTSPIGNTSKRAERKRNLAALGEVPPVESMAMRRLVANDDRTEFDVRQVIDSFCARLKEAGYCASTVYHAKTTGRILADAASIVLNHPLRDVQDLVKDAVIEEAVDRIRATRSAGRRLPLLARFVRYLHTGRLIDRTAIPECEQVASRRIQVKQPPTPRPISLDPAKDHPLAQAFIRELDAQNRRWQKRAKYVCRDLLTWLSGCHAFRGTRPIEIDLARVTREYLMGYRRHLEDLVRSGALSRGTFRLKVQAIRKWFAFLYMHNHVFSDPSAALPVVKGRELAPHRIVSAEEAKAFLEAVIRFSPAPLQDLAIFSCLSGLGLRPSEAVNLRVCDLDREAALLRVVGKGNKERAIPLPGPVLLSLERHLGARGHVKEDSPMWVGKLGGPLSYEMLRIRFHEFCRLAGIDRDIGGPHVFRHYFITQNLLNGVDLEDLAAVVGDDNIRSMQPYFHTTPAGIRAALLRAYGEGGEQT